MGDPDRREKAARAMYGMALYTAGYAKSPEEGEKHWGSLPVKKKAPYRRAAETARQATDRAMREVGQRSMQIPDPSRALTP